MQVCAIDNACTHTHAHTHLHVRRFTLAQGAEPRALQVLCLPDWRKFLSQMARTASVFGGVVKDPVTAVPILTRWAGAGNQCPTAKVRITRCPHPALTDCTAGIDAVKRGVPGALPAAGNTRSGGVCEWRRGGPSEARAGGIGSTLRRPPRFVRQ